MPSDRMMQAIGRLERALSTIEQVAEARLRTPEPLADREKAADALIALDALLAELKGAPHG